MSPKPILQLRVVTPEGIILNAAELTTISVLLVDGGAIGIRPGHAPLIAETVKGVVRYRKINSEEEINLHSGVLDINNNVVTILTAGEIAETASEFAKPSDNEYDRLMQTLINTLHPAQDQENN